MKLRNPFNSKKKEPVQPVQPLHQLPQSPQTQAQAQAQTQVQVLTTAQTATPKSTANSNSSSVVTEQTLDYLKKVELDDVLELMYPRLLQDQQNGIAACTAELAQIDQELTQLYTMRDDVLNSQVAHSANGVANF